MTQPFDPYAILGLERTCSADDVRAAFRKASLQHHPDTGGDRETFEALKRAEAILSDAERRRRYDETGDTGESKHSQLDTDRGAHTVFATIIENIIVTEQIDVETEDLVDMMREVLKARIGEIEGDLARLRRGVDRATKMRKRFKHKTQGDENAITGILAWNAKRIQPKVDQTEAKLKDHRRALELLADYSFDVMRFLPAETFTYATRTVSGSFGR